MENNSSLKNKVKNNLMPIIFGIAGIALIIFAAVMVLKKSDIPQDKYQDISNQKFENCETKKESYVVDGGTDIFPSGAKIDVELNYFACNKAQRDDIVMIKTPGKEQPLVKYIKMIPGDKYQIVQEKDKKYRIEVNGNYIENSKGEEYALSERKIRMIKLYESNFKEGIKENVYFVFGDSTAGGFDSTRFGPVMPERMIGKVLTSPSAVKKEAVAAPAVTPAPTAVEAPKTARALEPVAIKKTVVKPVSPKPQAKPAAAKNVNKTPAAAKKQ